MRVVIHWSECVLERRGYMIRWGEYDFAPLAPEDRSGPGTLRGWRHYRCRSVGVAVDVPIGSRVVTVHRPETSQRPGGVERRLAVYWAPYQAPYGMDAETAARLATNGERGFRVIGREDDLARKTADGQGWLLSAEPEGCAPPREPLGREMVARGQIDALAADVVAHAEQSMREAIRRALDQLRAATDRDELARIETARAILETALEVARA